jgi:hypothetical protein
VVFALAGTQHVCVTPDRDQSARIKAYCTGHGIQSNVTFIHESSDVALSSGQDLPPELDFVFIDGAHCFPFPIIDYHFTERRLRVGGILGVDDYLMPSVRILHDFLVGENEWELICLQEKTSFFRRSANLIVWDGKDHWSQQRLNRSFLEQQTPAKEQP